MHLDFRVLGTRSSQKGGTWSESIQHKRVYGKEKEVSILKLVKCGKRPKDSPKLLLLPMADLVFKEKSSDF